VIKHVKSRYAQTLQLILLNGLIVYRRVHHFWNDFPHECRFCGKARGDDWEHMLAWCPIIQQAATIIHDTKTHWLNPTHLHFTRTATMTSVPLEPQQITAHLTFIHALWVHRYLIGHRPPTAHASTSSPLELVRTFNASQAKAEKQRLLAAVRKAHSRLSEAVR